MVTLDQRAAASHIVRNDAGRPYVAAAMLRPYPDTAMRIWCSLISIDPIYCGQEELFYMEDDNVPPAA